MNGKDLGEGAHTFRYTIEERKRYLLAELGWPSYLLQRMPRAPAVRVLDVGAGFDLEPIYIHNATGGIARGAEVFGIDLNLSVLRSGARISAMQFVHYALADFFQMSWKGRIHYTLETCFRPTFACLPR